MKKDDLKREVAAITGLKLKDTEATINAILQVIAETLEAGEPIRLTGFGTLEVVKAAERSGMNPATKEKMVIPATNRIRFKASQVLKDAVK